MSHYLHLCYMASSDCEAFRYADLFRRKVSAPSYIEVSLLASFLNTLVELSSPVCETISDTHVNKQVRIRIEFVLLDRRR